MTSGTARSRRIPAGKDTSAAAIAVARRLPQLCHASSSMERTADAASRASQGRQDGGALLDEGGEQLPGIVTGCERFGLFVRLDDTCAEGLLPFARWETAGSFVR